jgi:ABC-type polysaccharide/polyol phosphate export permease
MDDVHAKDLSARFRDLPLIVANGVQIIFMITPIMWKPSQLTGERYLVAQLNPFHYLVDVLRLPLLGEMPPASTWLMAVIIIAASCAVAFWFFVRYRWRIAYWV